MIITYSHSEWFVPALQDLIDPRESSSRRCAWHKSRRTPKSDGAQLVKCSKPIAEHDAQRADRLLKELRSVLDAGKRCLEILRELSSLVLCKNAHRSSNAETISNFWVAELKTRNSIKEPSKPVSEPSPLQASLQPSVQPLVHIIPVTELLEQLGITIGQRVGCHGRGKRSAGCGNWINKSNGERVTAISKELAGNWRLSSTVLKLLEELSGLVMCQRWHQDQAPSKLKEWTVAINYHEDSRQEPQVRQTTTNPQTPTRQQTRNPAIETPETQTSLLWTSPRQSRSPESAATTPGSRLSWGQNTINSHFTSEPRRTNTDRQREQTCVSPTPISSRTRSMTKDKPNGSATLTNQAPCFEPFSASKSPSKAAEYVMEKIREKISIRELASGFLYGFRRPGCDLIKIGTTTTTVAKRMRAIATQCHYTPVVVFQVATNHAMKVEHLVHRQLYRQNRRECLISGRCNEARGCASRHKEWFDDVSDTYAEAVVRAWVRWMNLEPYDGEGVLKKAWVVQTKCFDLTAPGDIWMRWTEITMVMAIKKEEDEAIDAAIKTEKVLGAVSRLTSQLAVPKSEFPITIRAGLVPPIPLPSQVDVFA